MFGMRSYLSYIEKNVLYRLHFEYKNCISFTKVAFWVQKLRFVYKYSVISLQSGISVYKVAFRFTIQHSHLERYTND